MKLRNPNTPGLWQGFATPAQILLPQSDDFNHPPQPVFEGVVAHGTIDAGSATAHLKHNN